MFYNNRLAFSKSFRKTRFSKNDFQITKLDVKMNRINIPNKMFMLMIFIITIEIFVIINFYVQLIRMSEQFGLMVFSVHRKPFGKVYQ